MLEKNRYISDGKVERIVTNNEFSDIINLDTDKEIIKY